MKKALLFFAMLACTLAGWAQNAVVGTYTSNKLDVALSNNTEFVAFQMDIALTGAAFAGDPVADLDRLTENGGTNPFILASNVLSDGKLRVIAYNMANRSIAADAGTLFTVALDQKPSTVNITNVLFVKASDLAGIEIDATTKAGGKQGDVNGDGVVDTLDLAALINMLIGTIEFTEGADVDGNTICNTLDLAKLINLLLEK